MPKNAVFLLKPQLAHHRAFIDGLSELQAHQHERYYVEENLDLAQLSNKKFFKQHLSDLAEQELGINLAPNRVPQSIYWLMEEQTDGQLVWIGRVSIRHRLNDKLRKIGGHVGYVIRPSARRQGYGSRLLALTLEKIRQHQPKIDTKQALLTCDETNLGSKKIIEKNGGIFANSLVQDDSPVRKLRYWVPYT